MGMRSSRFGAAAVCSGTQLLLGLLGVGCGGSSRTLELTGPAALEDAGSKTLTASAEPTADGGALVVTITPSFHNVWAPYCPTAPRLERFDGSTWVPLTPAEQRGSRLGGYFLDGIFRDCHLGCDSGDSCVERTTPFTVSTFDTAVVGQRAAPPASQCLGAGRMIVDELVSVPTVGPYRLVTGASVGPTCVFPIPLVVLPL